MNQKLDSITRGWSDHFTIRFTLLPSSSTGTVIGILLSCLGAVTLSGTSLWIPEPASQPNLSTPHFHLRTPNFIPLRCVDGNTGGDQRGGLGRPPKGGLQMGSERSTEAGHTLVGLRFLIYKMEMILVLYRICCEGEIKASIQDPVPI